MSIPKRKLFFCIKTPVGSRFSIVCANVKKRLNINLPQHKLSGTKIIVKTLRIKRSFGSILAIMCRLEFCFPKQKKMLANNICKHHRKTEKLTSLISSAKLNDIIVQGRRMKFKKILKKHRSKHSMSSQKKIGRQTSQLHKCRAGNYSTLF